MNSPAIWNGLDELRDKLTMAHEVEIAMALAPRCMYSWFTHGGRVERVCGELADPKTICAECGDARCSEHDDESDVFFEDQGGKIVCEFCQREAA